jgi:hypothetical protein
LWNVRRDLVTREGLTLGASVRTFAGIRSARRRPKAKIPAAHQNAVV